MRETRRTLKTCTRHVVGTITWFLPILKKTTSGIRLVCKTTNLCGGHHLGGGGSGGGLGGGGDGGGGGGLFTKCTTTIRSEPS